VLASVCWRASSDHLKEGRRPVTNTSGPYLIG